MRFVGLLGGLVAVLAFSGSALAASQSARNDCKANDPDRSIAGCTQILQDKSELAHNRAIAYYDRGLAYADKGDLDQAIADYSKAIQLNPKFAAAYHNRGRAYRAKGDLDQAIADFTEAIRLNPKDTAAYLNRGNVYVDDKGNFDRAITDYDEVIRLNPKDAIAYNNRGLAYWRKGNIDQAIADFTEATNLDPKYTAGLDDLGNAFRYRGLLDTAIKLYTKAIQLDSKYARAHLDRGVAYLYEGYLNRALADATKARELAPDDFYDALWVDIVSQRRGRPGRLATAVSKLDMTKWPAPVVRLYLDQLTPGALFAAADDPDAWTKQGQLCEADFYLGELKLRQGDKKDAAQLLQTAENDCPQDFIEKISAVCELKALQKMKSERCKSLASRNGNSAVCSVRSHP